MAIDKPSPTLSLPKRVGNKILPLGEDLGGAIVLFRIAFGVMMALSILRFWKMGWIEQLYIKPSFFFTYYGFEWVKPLGENGMYALFAVMFASAVFIALGLFYRVASVLFFLTFTYVELIDKSTYLNHYYFISLIALLLCFIPAHRQFSLDVKFGITKAVESFPRWMVLSLQLQMAIVYFFAGIAKINHDWLFEAVPLKLWLPAKNNLPIIGSWLNEVWVAYVFSWCGMLFDTLIPFFLFWRKTKYYAYAVVVIFHVLTAILFPSIGMFPFIMIVCAMVFLPGEFHERVLGTKDEGRKTKAYPIRNTPLTPLRRGITAVSNATHSAFFPLTSHLSPLTPYIFIFHFTIQLLLPFRYIFYPEKLFWYEEGYRFSWRVMLMEKAGVATFHVKEAAGNRLTEIRNADYLTPQQEKQMTTQPDMLLQFAKHLAWVYEQQGWKKPEVYVESFVSLNGKGSRPFIDSNTNLAAQSDGFAHKKWILPYNSSNDKLLGVW